LRKHIINRRTKGKFIFWDKYTLDDVYCDYEYDLYSNHNMNGIIEFDGLSKDIYDDFMKDINPCKFIGNDGVYIEGSIFSLPLGHGKIKFQIEIIKEYYSYSNEEPDEIEISYYVPYITPLSREISRNTDNTKKVLFSFKKDEFTIVTDCKEIIFNEVVNLVKYDEPDYIFNRLMYPKLLLKINKDEDINKIIDNNFALIQKLMLIISFLLFNRINTFGYKVKVFGRNKLISQLKYRNAAQKSSEDYTSNIGYKFEKYFTSENISKLLNSYLHLDNSKLEKLERILYSFISISEQKIFGPKFSSTYFLLAAISKIIMQPKNYSKDEECIKLASEKVNIDIKRINFEISPKRLKKNNSKCEWLITEYRHELTHFNFEKYDIKILLHEYNKMMYLLRKLIIFYFEPSLVDFPYPNNRYDIVLLK